MNKSKEIEKCKRYSQYGCESFWPCAGLLFFIFYERLWENVRVGRWLDSWKGSWMQVCTNAIDGIWADDIACDALGKWKLVRLELRVGGGEERERGRIIYGNTGLPWCHGNREWRVDVGGSESKMNSCGFKRAEMWFRCSPPRSPQGWLTALESKL